MTTNTDLSTWTPVEIDTELAAIYARYATALNAMASAERYADSLKVGEYGYESFRGGRGSFLITEDDVEVAYERANELHLAAIAVLSEALPYENEYRNREWTRAWLVDNTNGHVHSTQHCSTCFATTQYYWLVSESGKDENEIVALAGERACTVCYKSAPTLDLSKPTHYFTPTEQEAQAAREAKLAKRAAKDAAKVFYPEGHRRHGSQYEWFKTERGAELEATSDLFNVLWYWYDGTQHPSTTEWLNNARLIAKALGEKRGVDAKVVLDGFVAKAEAKARKEKLANQSLKGLI